VIFCSRLRLSIFSLALFLAGTAWAQDGFGGKATGGAGGRQVVARTAEEFRAFVAAPDSLVVQMDAPLSVGLAMVASNKTIVGANSGATLTGTIMLGGGTQNVIIRNLTFTNPLNKKGKGGGDGITIRGGKNVWIDHCTFHDCGDGCVDITEGADLVTVSWCKFSYTRQPDHRFTMLAMGRDKKKHKNKAKVTLHHNWWAENCDQRMPAARKAQVHMYNNYFTCSGNAYCSNARENAELLSEGNYYEKVQNPCYSEDGGKIKTVKNIYKDCTGKIAKGDDKVFTPPYAWKVAKVGKVPEIVRAGAGAR
jgi:pectate lyase